MKTGKTAGSIIALLTALTTGITASAEVINVTTDVYQPDKICGYVNIQPVTETDVYVNIKKITPESTNGYDVYNEPINADVVHVGDIFTYSLEYNNFSFDSNGYEGWYDIAIGVHKHKYSDEADDIVYTHIQFLAEDIDICGHESFCNIIINLTDKDIYRPVIEESGELPNKTYNVTFAYIDYVWGDANGDTIVNIRDAALIASKVSKMEADTLPFSADYNRDDIINIRDAAAIAKYVASKGQGENTPVEEPTETPSETPSETPTESPTETPTETPSESPTEVSTQYPAEEETTASTEVTTDITEPETI